MAVSEWWVVSNIEGMEGLREGGREGESCVQDAAV